MTASRHPGAVQVQSTLTIYVRDLDATMRFYALAFGLALQCVILGEHGSSPMRAARVALQDGRLMVEWIPKRDFFEKERDFFEKVGVETKPTEPVEGLSLRIQVDDVMQVSERALEAGAVSIEEYDTPLRRVVCLRDPDGVTIEVTNLKLVPSATSGAVG